MVASDMMLWRRVVFGGGIVVAGICHAAPTPRDAASFTKVIRPILSGTCFQCHGPDAATRKAHLRLDQREGLFGVTDGGAIVVPGDPESSVLWQRITATDRDDRMPPEGAAHTLSDAEIATIGEWITAGATWQGHWAFDPPARPSLPVVSDQQWCRDAIDAHILAGLEQGGMTPSPQAGKATVLRRLRFDLTGLPPTAEELDAFEADVDPGAVGRAVDRLLSLPAYGEHMAAQWLDLARYADTYGYQSDVGRHVWPYRDWVVRAFNDGLPYDDFLTWQLAGDLLQDPTSDQQLATAFNRLHRQTNEGGSVEEEFRVEYVSDRVDTFSTAMLGLTAQCARCHDHKFDPISHREYYALWAYFDDIDECGLYSHFTSAVPTPALDLPTPEQLKVIATLEAEVDRQDAAMETLVASSRPGFEEWVAAGGQWDRPMPTGHYPLDDVATGTLSNLAVPENPGKTTHGPASMEGVTGTAAHLSGDDNIHFPEVGHVTRVDPFTLSLWIKVPTHFERAVIIHRSRSWTDAGSQGYQLLLEDGHPTWSLVHFWPGDAISIRGVEPLPLDEWMHVAVVHDGSVRAQGLSMYINGVPAGVEVVHDHLTRAITGGSPGHLTVGERFRDNGFTGGGVDEVQVFDTALTAMECAELHGTVTPDDDEELFDVYLCRVDEAWRQAEESLHVARKSLAEARNGVAQIMTMRASDSLRQAYILDRGRYDLRGDPVTPGTPAALGGNGMDRRDDRLGLAQWLTDPDHPLTARVVVNRLWKQVFGRGLVATTGDFGSQGEVPSNGDLLDMLAVDFIESEWDVKAMLRRLLTTATYQQVSAASMEARRRDPQNRLLGRGPARRLSAEMVRDQALAASGLLVSKVGGPPVYPPQPPGLWQEKSGAAYPSRQGEDRRRRSVYTYWKRTSPPPSMMMFDASHRETCVADRGDTSTPLQALVLLNDEQFVEAARVLAQRSLVEGGGDVPSQISWAFRAVTSRSPTPDELEVLLQLHQRQRVVWSEEEADAASFTRIGPAATVDSISDIDVAAMTVICSTLLSTDAALMRR